MPVGLTVRSLAECREDCWREMLKKNQNNADIISRLFPCHCTCYIKMPDETTQKSQPPERRYGPRSMDLSNPMAEIKFSGSPIYMLKVRDLSDKGAGVIVKSDSSFIKTIEIGQELNVRLILPRYYTGPSGNFRARVEHITEIQEGRFKGHLIVGLSFLPRIN
jgi:hypothetical protein